MKKIKLGIIYGGMSTEHEVSIVSAKSVIANLDKEKYDVYEFFIDKDGNWLDKNKEEINNIFTLLRNLDVVFPVLHGKYGEDRHNTGIV